VRVGVPRPRGDGGRFGWVRDSGVSPSAPSWAFGDVTGSVGRRSSLSEELCPVPGGAPSCGSHVSSRTASHHRHRRTDVWIQDNFVVSREGALFDPSRTLSGVCHRAGPQGAEHGSTRSSLASDISLGLRGPGRGD